MALRLLTIEWEGLESTEGAKSLDRMRAEVERKRSEIAGLLLDVAHHPGRWHENRYEHVGKVVDMEGKHEPSGDNTCCLSVVFDDECMAPAEAIEKMRAFLRDEVFGSIELTIGIKEVPPDDLPH